MKLRAKIDFHENKMVMKIVDDDKGGAKLATITETESFSGMTVDFKNRKVHFTEKEALIMKAWSSFTMKVQELKEQMAGAEFGNSDSEDEESVH